MLPTEKSHRTNVPETKTLKLRLMRITNGFTYRKYYNYTLFKLQHTTLTISSYFITEGLDLRVNLLNVNIVYIKFTKTNSMYHKVMTNTNHIELLCGHF